MIRYETTLESLKEHRTAQKKNKQTEKTSIFCLLRTHENSCTLKKEEVISSVFLKTAFMCVCSMCIAAIIGKLLWT